MTPAARYAPDMLCCYEEDVSVEFKIHIIKCRRKYSNINV